MTEANTQAVATTDAQAQPAAEATGARVDDLDSLLSQFNEANPEPKPAQPAAPTNEVSVLRARLDAIEQGNALSRNRSDTDTAVKELKGDLSIPEYVVKGWLMDKAGTEPTINKIWDMREQNPAAAKKLVAKLKQEFQKEQAALAKSQPDPDATADTLAVTAAVKGASSKAPPEQAPNYGAMNDADFRKELAKYA